MWKNLEQKKETIHLGKYQICEHPASKLIGHIWAHSNIFIGPFHLGVARFIWVRLFGPCPGHLWAHSFGVGWAHLGSLYLFKIGSI